MASRTSSPSSVASPAPLPTSRPSTARAKSSSSGPALACAPPHQARAPLPTHPKPIATAAPRQPKPEPVPLPRLSAVAVAVPPAPDTKMSMAAVVGSGGGPVTPIEGPKISMTSKEWVIPPRPKPGRKPATDTPPTKRKAQNRAAQRAFRERRAARVGELEEQLDQFRAEYEKKESDLKDKVHSLELDVQSFRSRCMLLENMLDRERQDRIRVETEAETLRRRHSEHAFRNERMNSAPSHRDQHHHHSMQQQQPQQQQHRHSMSNNNRLPHPETSRDFSISQIITPPESMDSQNPMPLADADITCGGCSTDRCACAEEVLASATAGCGKCGFGTKCQCLEELGPSRPVNDLKRPSSPSNAGSAGKRVRQESSSRPSDHEMDFTTAFSRRQSQITTPIHTDPPPSQMMSMPSALDESFKESCGFCKDGTYCACADAAMATPAMTPPETQPAVPRQVQTPPPSETDVVPPQPFIMEMTADGAVKLPPRKPKAGQPAPATKASGGGCGAGAPGTCAQCQADPKSGLFCRLMNAKFGKEQSGGGCCGGKGAGGGCCKSKPSSGSSSIASSNNNKKEDEKITLPSLPSLGLSCAEAYQTLASHRNFSEAANDINSWLPKLKATARASSSSSSSRQSSRGRMPIEVEAASIMSVLKEFDIRFGREC